MQNKIKTYPKIPIDRKAVILKWQKICDKQQNKTYGKLTVRTLKASQKKTYNYIVYYTPDQEKLIQQNYKQERSLFIPPHLQRDTQITYKELSDTQPYIDYKKKQKQTKQKIKKINKQLPIIAEQLYKQRQRTTQRRWHTEPTPQKNHFQRGPNNIFQAMDQKWD